MGFSDFPRYLSCDCCQRTRPESAADARTTAACFLCRGGICCLKPLATSGCRWLSTISTDENVHSEEQDRTKLNDSDKNVSDAVRTKTEYDAESTDSGVQISQESTVDSVSALFAATPHRTTDPTLLKLTPKRPAIHVREMFPSTASETARNTVFIALFTSSFRRSIKLNALNIRKNN